MLKIITLFVVFLTVVLLHGAHGAPVGTEESSTAKPRLIRVRLYKANANRDVVKREIPEEDLEFFGGHRSPIMRTKKAEFEPTEDFFKGFEARELEEKLAQVTDVAEDPAEATDGKALTDDENQRFDVETTSTKINPFEEMEAFFDKRHVGGCLPT